MAENDNNRTRTYRQQFRGAGSSKSIDHAFLELFHHVLVTDSVWFKLTEDIIHKLEHGIHKLILNKAWILKNEPFRTVTRICKEKSWYPIKSNWYIDQYNQLCCQKSSQLATRAKKEVKLLKNFLARLNHYLGISDFNAGCGYFQTYSGMDIGTTGIDYSAGVKKWADSYFPPEDRVRLVRLVSHGELPGERSADYFS